MTENEIIKGRNSRRERIIEKATQDGGKIVRMWGDNRPALLLGAIEDTCDYYWFVMYGDLRYGFSSCVGGYDVIEDEEIPAEMSVIQYMRENDAEGLMDRIKKTIRKFGDDEILMTEIKVKC